MQKSMFLSDVKQHFTKYKKQPTLRLSLSKTWVYLSEHDTEIFNMGWKISKLVYRAKHNLLQLMAVREMTVKGLRQL